MRDLQGWIFDLDGTLTLAQHDFAAIRRELGVPSDSDILTYIAGLPAAEATAMKAELDQIELRLAQEVEAAPGAVELIRYLHQQGRRLGILTRNLRCVAISTLQHLDVLDCFAPEDVLGREEAAPKPHPEGIELLLQRWQLSPAQSGMVGDFHFDLQTGRAAGSNTCLVHPQNQWPELADWHAVDCRNLLALL